MKRTLVVGLSLALSSCARQQAAPPPPLVDYTAAQRDIWSQIPSETTFGVSAGRFGHLIDRARALRAVVSAGPTTRKKLDAVLSRAQTKLGFDALDAAAWTAHGIVVDSPIGVFGDDKSGHFAVFVAVNDAQKARAVLEPLLSSTCRDRGKWLACGDDLPAAASVAQSRWNALANEPLARSEIFGAFDIAGSTKASDAGDFFTERQRVVGGINLGDERMTLQVRYDNPHAGELKPYVTRDPGGKSLLAAARGSIGFARFSFSPSALWALAKRKASPRTIETASNAMLAATGIDLKADLVDNLTGEIFGGLWEPPSMMSTLLIGTRDDKRTTDMARRLDGIFAGLIGSLDGKDGIKASHGVETTRGLSMYVYKLDFSQLMKDVPGGMTQLEMHFGAAPGALLLAFDRKNRDRAIDALAGSPRDFLDSVDPEVRAALSRDSVVSGWGHGADFSQWYRSPDTQKLMKPYSKIDADLPAVITELSSLSELIYDNMVTLAVHDKDITLDWTMRLL